MPHADVAVVGAGMAGIACALAAALRGHSVVLFERGRRAQGASVLNPGMILPVGQPRGFLRRRALCSRRLWLELAREVGFWIDDCGSLHLAHHSDELGVLEEFAASNPDFELLLLSASEAASRSPALRKDALLGALWSPHELCVDPREALRVLPQWLATRHDVLLRFGTHVASVASGRVVTAQREVWNVSRVLVCSGAETAALYPETLQDTSLQLCKRLMLRTLPQPSGWRLGPHLLSGLALIHTPAFRTCPSLPMLRRRIEERTPEILRLGIQATLNQNGLGELVIGDSQEHGQTVDPADPERAYALILEALGQVFVVPRPELAERWHCVQVQSIDRSELVTSPEPDVWLVNGLGNAGMTLCFGLAEELWDAIEERRPWDPRG